MKATTVKEGLIATKWILENYGWCQGYYQVDEGGNVVGDPINLPFCGSCLSGALELVQYEDDDLHFDPYNDTKTLVYKRVCAFTRLISGLGTITQYNDHPERTKEQ